MDLLHNATQLNPVTRRGIAVLTMVIALTSVRVQAAQAESQLPAPPVWLTEAEQVYDTTEEQGIVVPKRVPSQLSGAPDKPKKVWNTINAPDLETRPEYSAEPAQRVMTVVTTAYNSERAQTDATPFTTANGTRVRDGIIAANFLKFGTRVRIPDHFGDKVFEVHDRMNPRYNQRVDIWMLNKADAKAWGARRVKIEILN